jgi:hypothetical protein
MSVFGSAAGLQGAYVSRQLRSMSAVHLTQHDWIQLYVPLLSV